jgi:hypothetical protein
MFRRRVICMAQAKALKQISGLNGRHRGKPPVLQIDAEKDDTSK